MPVPTTAMRMRRRYGVIVPVNEGSFARRRTPDRFSGTNANGWEIEHRGRGHRSGRDPSRRAHVVAQPDHHVRGRAGPPLALLLAMGMLWGVAAGPIDLALFFAMYVICGLGISLGFHRYFTHRSFQARPWFKVTLAILGSMTLQGPVTQWVTDHRKHHALSDQPGDPHSPHAHDGDTWIGNVFGMWHAHVGWLFRTKGMERGDHYGRDLLEDPTIRLVDRLYFLWVALHVRDPVRDRLGRRRRRRRARPAGHDLGRRVRIFLFQHATWAVNSVCHRFGSRDFETRDESRNNLAVAMLHLRRGLAQQPPRVPGQRPPRPAAAPVRPHRAGREAARALARDLGREAARRHGARAPARPRRLRPGSTTGASVRGSRVECDPLDLSSGGT